MPSRVFLLSPANCRGRRAQHVMSPRATASVAGRLRSADGVPIGELFAHLSGLYFRGKLTYARRFATGPAGAAVLVITPNRGLVPADTALTMEALRQFADAEICADNPAYREPLEQSARSIASLVPADGEFVLLGSIASDKYVNILSPVFGARLLFPAAFVGRGDMSRGGLLLRSAACARELDYVPVLGAARTGPRPPRLARAGLAWHDALPR